MTRVIDLWRAVDVEARLASGEAELLGRIIRGVARTRAAPPHLPEVAEDRLLVVDGGLVTTDRLDPIVAALAEAGLAPAAVWIAMERVVRLEPSASEVPVIVGGGPTARVADAAAAHLEREADQLAALSAAVRLAGAEAALADPRPSAPAGELSARMARGVAVTVDGRLEALHPRGAGRALATRFAAAHARLLVAHDATGSRSRRTRDGIWLLERQVGPGASVWLFDDVPFARVDEVALDALAITVRALLRRPPTGGARARVAERVPPSTGDPLRDTLIAVARANGRTAPAARALGVHRNTVLYRLRRAAAELGIDPRRPEDAIRLLRDEPP